MKKIFLLTLIILLLCGCKKERIMNCSYINTNEELKYTEEIKYKVYYNRKEYVTKIEKNEYYYSEDEDRINYFNDYKNIHYNELNNLYNGYTYNIEKNKNDVKISIIIDLKEVNLKKMVINKFVDKYYIVNNHLSLGGLKLYYKDKQVKCDI